MLIDQNLHLKKDFFVQIRKVPHFHLGHNKVLGMQKTQTKQNQNPSEKLNSWMG